MDNIHDEGETLELSPYQLNHLRAELAELSRRLELAMNIARSLKVWLGPPFLIGYYGPPYGDPEENGKDLVS